MFSSRKTSAPSTGYNLTKSLRFRSSASAYLNRTPSSATNQKTFTFSFWIKRGLTAGAKYVFSANSDSNASNAFGIAFYPDLEFFQNSSGSAILDLASNALYVDPSAWYHVVIAIDTTQATASNRAIMYVNGNQITSLSVSTYPSQNTNLSINSAVAHYINRLGYNTTAMGDQYITDFYLIDGQALTPSSFGSFSSTTGVWQPIAYTGTYGTNGFHLPFTNTTSTTTLGYDTSGNSNNWTTNNISLTAGNTYDSMNDVPTLTSVTVANYCVWNPNYNPQTAVITDGNLTLSTAGSPGRYGTYTTIGVSSGKWYWEITAGPLSSDGYEVGIANPNKPATTALGADINSYIYLSGGSSRTNGTTVSYGSTYTAGDIIGVAMDLNAGTLIFYKNGVNQGTAFTSIPSSTWFPTVADDNTASTVGSSFYANFGQQPFAYTPPSGYVALNTYNLPTPSIAQGNKYMDATLYSGNNGTQSITNAGAFQPDFLWIKSRSSALNHNVWDSVRTRAKFLYSNLANAEATSSAGVDLISFDSSGFTLGQNSSANSNSSGGVTYVAWQWQAGAGTSGSNTNGSITSTVSVSTTAGFSVSIFTSQASGNATFGHGIGIAPALVILKTRVSGNDWIVWHTSIAASQYLVLDATTAAATGTTYFNSTAPTSSVVTLGTAYAGSASMVAYCFAPVAGFSAFGSYTGNGSATGPFIYTGFQPKYLLIKRTDSTSDWYIWDSVRNTFNTVTNTLLADTAGAETSASSINVLSNGFQCVSATVVNVSTGTYIYAAFASNPFKYANAF